MVTRPEASGRTSPGGTIGSAPDGDATTSPPARRDPPTTRARTRCIECRLDEHTVEIVDHKVTTYARTAEQLHDDRQLNLYGYFALEAYPWAERVVVTHHYPPLRRTVSVELSPDTMRDVVASLVAIARTAEADSEYAPTPGEHCDNCPWADRCEAAPAGARS